MVKMFFLCSYLLSPSGFLGSDELEQNMNMWGLHADKTKFTSTRLRCRTEERLEACSMNEPGHFPPPDFGSPPPNSLRLPGSSSFHPSMWSWGDTPSEAGWHNGAAAGFGFPSSRGNYGPKRPYGELTMSISNANIVVLVRYNWHLTLLSWPIISLNWIPWISLKLFFTLDVTNAAVTTKISHVWDQ